jgi:hypothetical protein
MNIINEKIVDMTFDEFCRGGKSITPGPWVIDLDWLPDEHPDWRCIIIESGDKHFRTRVSGHMGEANARLIAAAPELLEALRGLAYPGAYEGQPSESERIAAARAAIAKAEGKNT